MDGSGLQYQRILQRAGDTFISNGGNPDFFQTCRSELYGLCDAGSFAADWQHLWRNVCVPALPPLLSVSGLTNAKWLSTYPLFHICALFGANTQAVGIMLLLIVLAVCYLCTEYLFTHFK